MSEDVTELFDLRVIVERIEGRSVCGLEVGDYFELTESSRLRIPPSKHSVMIYGGGGFDGSEDPLNGAIVRPPCALPATHPPPS